MNHRLISSKTMTHILIELADCTPTEVAVPLIVKPQITSKQ